MRYGAAIFLLVALNATAVLRSPKDQPSTSLAMAKPVPPRYLALPAFRYPKGATNYLWCLEATSDFRRWVPVLRNCYGPPKGTLTITPPPHSGHQDFRMRRQRGVE